MRSGLRTQLLEEFEALLLGCMRGLDEETFSTTQGSKILKWHEAPEAAHQDCSEGVERRLEKSASRATLVRISCEGLTGGQSFLFRSCVLCLKVCLIRAKN